jgi:hypothetical protein
MSIYSPDDNEEFWNSLKKVQIFDSDFVTNERFSYNKDYLNPAYGIRFNLTTEQKLKISLSQIGKPLSKSHRESISKSKTGIPRSEETKRKISESRKGQKISEETKRKISISKTNQQ